MTGLVHGLVPLPSKPFALLGAVERDAAGLSALVEAFGSPLHLLDPAPVATHAEELHAAARALGVPARVFFARKANKSITIMQRAIDLGLGVDVASRGELEQAVAAGARGDGLVVTAAVKTDDLLQAARAVGARVALDHPQEAQRWAAARAGGSPGPVAVRLAPRLASGIPTRFGMTPEEITALAADPAFAGAIEGVQFHVDGYAAADRAEAARQALAVIDQLRELGHPVQWLDIGGGIPMRYVDDAPAWERFWAEHRAALLDDARQPLTFRRHGLGLVAAGDQIAGTPAVYPVAQELIRGPWLREVLLAPAAPDPTLAAALIRRGLRLHLEPGRALLDGCGVTVARVAFTKRAVDGLPLVGLEMNRTQVRSAADDFLVDPLLIRPPGGAPAGTPLTGHLVGAYCVERELITWRTLRFPQGVAPGDLVAFPNTAGYLMHIVESASHGLPLASNVVVDPSEGRLSSPVRDPADALPLTRP